MRFYSKHTVEELERYIHMYLDEGWSYRELYEKGLLLSNSTFYDRVILEFLQSIRTTLPDISFYK